MRPANLKINIVLLISISLLTFGKVRADVLGPLLPKSAAEIGVQFRWIHRDVGTLDSPIEIDQYDASLPMRFGITEYVTLFTELIAANEDFHSIDTELRYYLLGGGAQALFWKDDNYIVSGCISFTETYIRRTDDGSCDQSQWGITGIVQLQRSFRWRDQDLTFWGGPLFSQYTVIQQESNGCRGRKWGTSDVLGAGLGLNVLFFDHYQIYYNFIYVGYYQPRIGISYRF